MRGNNREAWCAGVVVRLDSQVPERGSLFSGNGEMQMGTLAVVVDMSDE